MDRIYDPTQLTHPKLREFAFMAAWISVLVETEQDLEDLNVDLTPEERALPDFRTPWPWEFDTLSLAKFVVQMNREETEKGVEELLAGWMSEDRENWPVLRLTLIDPWQERPGIWSEHTPEWIRILAT
jgi:hypothetical protein